MRKRGRKYAFPEGEETLFYQRRLQGDMGSSESFAACGASASTLENVKYGCSSGQSISPQSISGAVEHTANEASLLEIDEGVNEDCFMDDECEWEFGSAGLTTDARRENKPWGGEIQIEMNNDSFDVSENKERKKILRANAKDKEFAELVHKAHLLCMIARGRLVDAACDDLMLQASLLSIVPDHIRFDDTERLSISDLVPFVKWFQSFFRIHSEKSVAPSYDGVLAKDDFVTHLLNVLQKQVGSSEEIAALSVSLLRALGITARYVAVLDVLSLKPDPLSLEASRDWEASNANEVLLSEQLLAATLASNAAHILSQVSPQSFAMSNALSSPAMISFSSDRGSSQKGSWQKQNFPKNNSKLVEPAAEQNLQNKRKKRIEFESNTNQNSYEKKDKINDGTNVEKDICATSGSQRKRKGDLEFELQLEMAMAATAGSSNIESQKQVSTMRASTLQGEKMESPNGEKKKSIPGKSSKHTGTCSTVWSRKMGALLNWAEVFCLEKDDAKWVHVDAGRGILDGAEMVEEAARSNKVPLRYVLAFAGNGAKDVTRRYITLWSAIAPLRVNNDWWNITLAPLKHLEAAKTSTKFRKEEEHSCHEDKEMVSSAGVSSKGFTPLKQLEPTDRSSLEDMELDIKACTEPLPQNQRAYKNHHLYALERWLTKYQCLHPRGPILGYCGGHPVFPRACVQDLHTAERWLREGLMVKQEELPAKILKTSTTSDGQKDGSINVAGENPNASNTTALFGRWQTEPWQPPRATNGIVPKNERGNVELWSEKCLPPGTIHISLPRILQVAKKLEIDFAQALVGFEIRNRRPVPIFEGIVVCEEFETTLLEAYAEEEYRRNKETEKRRESLACTRWCQLLRAITLRQRLQATYQVFPGCHQSSPNGDENRSQIVCPSVGQAAHPVKNEIRRQKAVHEHSFPEHSQNYDEETGIRTKICSCGFTLQVEEM
ncbi:hypothetical protein KP509_12G062000 [Ceratopteris richardii]|nr:hypothetical protein KP509_12G062000 [Ceratopteris richardii]